MAMLWVIQMERQRLREARATPPEMAEPRRTPGLMASPYFLLGIALK